VNNKSNIERIRVIMDERGIVLSNREVTPQVFEMTKSLAPVMHMSRIMGVGSPDQAIAVMLKGYELGMSLTTSFEFIQIVDGKPSLSPRGALALLHNSKEIDALKITRLVDAKGNFYGYECYMKRGNFEHTGKFTLDDARKAGLVKAGGNWEKYPENMCQWRAIGFCIDVVAPDITGGLTFFLKMPETENVQVSDTGDWIQAETKIIDVSAAGKPKVDVDKLIGELGFPPDKPKQQPVVIVQKPQPITLDELLSNFGAEKILSVNSGKIPGTDGEVQEVAVKLLGG
jgi:hypothetical protein